ncbi:hypothetical protein BsWGS_28235 [Bradybaena similaris]
MCYNLITNALLNSTIDSLQHDHTNVSTPNHGLTCFCFTHGYMRIEKQTSNMCGQTTTMPPLAWGKCMLFHNSCMSGFQPCCEPQGLFYNGASTKPLRKHWQTTKCANV